MLSCKLYNHMLRMVIASGTKWCSASKLFVLHNVAPFNALIRKAG